MKTGRVLQLCMQADKVQMYIQVGTVDTGCEQLVKKISINLKHIILSQLWLELALHMISMARLIKAFVYVLLCGLI